MINNTAAAIKPITIIVSVDNPPNISTPISPRAQRHLAPKSFASSQVKQRARTAAMFDHITAPRATTRPALARIGGPDQIVRYQTARKLQRKLARRRADRQKPQRRLAIKTIIYRETEQRRLLDLRLTETSRRKERPRARAVIRFYPSVERPAVNLIVQRSQPTLAYRSIFPFSLRGLRNRSEDNNAKQKGMKRYREELNDRPVLRRKQHQFSLKPCHS